LGILWDWRLLNLVRWEKVATEEVNVDNKGRAQIPKAIRDKVGLNVGGKAR
jgi:hypothetical protein